MDDNWKYGDYSTFAINEDDNTLTYENLIEAIERLPKLKAEDNLLSIVITKHAPEIELRKCQLEKGFHFLVRKNVWRIISNEINSIQYFTSSFFPSFWGVPIYEDDAMAIKIISDSREYDEKLFKIRYENYMKYLVEATRIPEKLFNSTGS